MTLITQKQWVTDFFMSILHKNGSTLAVHLNQLRHGVCHNSERSMHLSTKDESILSTEEEEMAAFFGDFPKADTDARVQ